MSGLAELDIKERLSGSDAQALFTLAKGVRRQGMVAINVGTFKGHSASILASVVRDEAGICFCIDNWKGAEGTLNEGEYKAQNIHKIFRTNMEALGLLETVADMTSDSARAASYFQAGIADIVFIDADHKYQGIKADIQVWLPKVKKGGILCGHDCQARYANLGTGLKRLVDANLSEEFVAMMHVGVIKALSELLPEHKIMPTSTVWYWAKQ